MSSHITDHYSGLRYALPLFSVLVVYVSNFFSLLIVVLSIAGCNTTSVKSNLYSDTIHDAACVNKSQHSKSPWNISNLYNCEQRELFIPYQLWSGETWDGNKFSACMHEANTLFYVNGKSGTTIKGPKTWRHPWLNTEIKVWYREKVNGSKQQYFTCHEKGIGRVYDSRRGYYSLGRCKFPAGFGWQIGVQRECNETAIEITKIELDDHSNLTAMEFKWWFENNDGELIHDHTYRYEPNIGSVNAWEQ